MSINANPERAPRPRWRLSTRLIATVVAIFAVILIVSVISHLQYRHDRKESRIESMQQVSRTVAALFDGFTGDLEAFALSTAVTLGQARISTDLEDSLELQPQVRPYLQRLHDIYGVLRAIFVVNRDGIVVLSNVDEGLGTDLSDRRYFQEVAAGRESYWSGAFAGSETGQTTVTHTRQIVDPDGAVLGYLVVAFYPQALAARLPPDLANEGHVTLVDQDGVVLLQIPEPPAYSLEPEYPVWTEIAADGEILVRSDSVPLNEGDDYGSLSRMERLGWTIGYSVPASAIDGQANNIFQRDLLILGGVLIVSLGAMLLIAGRLSRPIGQLAEFAAAIARGDPTPANVNLKSSDADVAVLVETMEAMKRSVAVREEQLRLQSRIFESIESMGESLARELDLGKTIKAITDCGLEIANAEAAVFLRLDQDGEARTGYLEPTSARLPVTLSADDPLIAQVALGMFVHGSGRQSDNAPESANGQPPRVARSALGIPIRARNGSVLGGLFLLHSRELAFSGQDQRMAMGLGRWSEIVLENAQLYQESVELTEGLRKTNEDKDEFLAVVSHELRTPITTIYGGARLLKLRRDKLSDEAIDEMITSVAEESERLYRLVEDLLAIARTEMSRKVELESVSLAEVLDQTVIDFERWSSRPVETSLAPDLPDALAEPSYLHHVVYNLLTNANKYSPPDQPIEIDVRPEGSDIAVRVTDRGTGVPADELPLIFDRFYRSTDAVASQISGKGLGLTVCKRLIEALSGEIWAVNREGGGLEVGFTLPAVKAPEIQAVAEQT